MDAMVNVAPVHITAFPASNRLVAANPTGPKKLWTKGRVKLPILYPDRLIISKALCCLVPPRLIRYPAKTIIRLPANPSTHIKRRELSMEMRLKFEIMAQGRVMRTTTFEKR